MSKTYTIALEDAQDDTNDAMLPIPEEMLDVLEWEEGTHVNMSLIEDGKLIVKRID